MLKLYTTKYTFYSNYATYIQKYVIFVIISQYYSMRLTLIIFITSITTVCFAQTSYFFSRKDSVAVYHGIDSLHLAWAGGINSLQVSNIDLNFDGAQDLFVFDRTGNKVLTFLHTGQPGTPNYRYAPQYEVFFPKMEFWVLLRDYNCDGLPDIFTSTPGGIKVYKNTSVPGNINFQLITPNFIYSYQINNYVNLYVSSVDIPSISDIDGDGDLDILTYGVLGTQVEYHKNLSVESGYNCDSLKYMLKNNCWGQFAEDAFNCSLYLNQSCSNAGIGGGAELPPHDADTLIILPHEERWYRHSGSGLCAIDYDGDKVYDLLDGDVGCTELRYLHNGGNLPNTNSAMDFIDNSFPSNTIAAAIDVFPAAFQVDVNNDGHRDLLVSPQLVGSSENQASLIYYRNNNVDSLPVYQHIQQDFLQHSMIDKGEGAVPVLADYNGDGLLDLFVANFGTWITASQNLKSKLALYKNIGTLNNPRFELVSDNFGNLDLIINKLGLYPAFGDLDNDGDIDMVLGNTDGTLSYFRNIAAPGNPASFQLINAIIQDDQNQNIDVGQDAAPHLIDLDRDGKLDLITGNRNGKIWYFRNVGTTLLHSFKQITNNLGQVDVTAFGDINGYSIPWVIDSMGNYQLFVGSKSGYIHHYNNIDNNLSGAFTLIDSTVFDMPTGIRTAPTLADLNNDGKVDMIVGNYRGGLTYFTGSNNNVGIKEITKNNLFYLYPNPTTNIINIRTNQHVINAAISMFDIYGNKIYSDNINNNYYLLNVSQISSGVYIITIQTNKGIETHKIVIHR